jgi:hypothetical protein
MLVIAGKIESVIMEPGAPIASPIVQVDLSGLLVPVQLYKWTSTVGRSFDDHAVRGATTLLIVACMHEDAHALRRQRPTTACGVKLPDDCVSVHPMLQVGCDTRMARRRPRMKAGLLNQSLPDLLEYLPSVRRDLHQAVKGEGGRQAVDETVVVVARALHQLVASSKAGPRMDAHMSDTQWTSIAVNGNHFEHVKQ